jgi:hypothetical protein
VTDPDGWELEVESSGILRLRADSGATLELHPSADGYTLRGGDAPEPLRLATTDEGAGLRLHDDARELGRTTLVDPEAGPTAPAYLLLDDGRLFRIVQRAPDDPGYELWSWEVPAPYLEATPRPDGRWRLAPTVAGAELEGWDRILPLLAATIVPGGRRPRRLSRTGPSPR